MKRYKINPAVHEVYSRDTGKVVPGVILEGDFERYSPEMLVEVPATSSPTTLEGTVAMNALRKLAPALTEPAPSPAVPRAPESTPSHPSHSTEEGRELTEVMPVEKAPLTEVQRSEAQQQQRSRGRKGKSGSEE